MREAASFMSRQSSAAPTGVLQSLLQLLRSAYKAHIRRSELMRLSEVDDHLLADVGLTREDVRWVLDLTFSHDPGIELQRRALRNSRGGWRSH